MGVLRSHHTEEKINEWALVLSSGSIPYEITQRDGLFTLSVEEQFFQKADTLLREYDKENLPSLPEEQKGGAAQSFSALAVSSLLVAFFALGKLTGLEPDLLRIGSASAQKILQGELWRTVTALSLHADLLHVLSNAFACWVFCAPVISLYGTGAGWALILLCGASGNLITALIYHTAHNSVGASTALFGAVGLLGAWRCAFGRRYRLLGRRTWIYIAGTLALVAVIGVGENVDLLSHLFGAVMGVLFGFPVARKMSSPSSLVTQNAQFTIAAGSAAVVLLCWICALYLT